MAQFLENGIIFGQTAFKILKTISDHDQNHNIVLDEIHLKSNKTYNYTIKKISNCKVEVTGKPKYFIYSPTDSTKNFITLNLMINSTLQKVILEDILDVQINVLLQPIIDLRKCESLNEALMNWSLNNIFLQSQEYFNHKKLISLNIVSLNLKRKIFWFLKEKNVQKFVPKNFLQKVNRIQKSKKNYLILLEEFMDIIQHINQHFIKMVKKYYKMENVAQIQPYNFTFPIELYGNREEINECRKSLYLVRKNKDFIHLKSFAILFNLRWFFNTRYNSKKSLGFDKEYGITIDGYGQTLHKYDDVLLWLITHPNTIEDVEFVVLDPIPSNYIFKE